MDEQLRSLVMRKVPVGDLRCYAMAKGMVTLREDGWAKVCEGITTVEEILRVTQEDAQPAMPPTAVGTPAPALLSSVDLSLRPRETGHGNGRTHDTWDLS
jgi:hypothetical protein